MMIKNVSIICLMLCYLFMTYTAFVFYPKWKQTGTEATISWDVSGYYMYLPAMFIYNDLKKIGFKDEIMAKYHPTPDFQQAYIHEQSGNYVMKYSGGQAITMAPFFFAAHTYCKVSQTYPADGFSVPYQFCIGFGMLMYAFIGLFFLRKILLLYFKDSTVAIVLLCYVFGSNYLNYSSIDQAMTHNVLFTIYCLLIYFTIQFYKNYSTKNAVAIGFLVGLATLIRPTEIISCLIPALWQINNFEDIKSKFLFIKNYFSKFLFMVVMALMVISVQMIYWKYATGEWIVYSYGDQGFSWLKPHVFNYTISYHSGWLRYTPMMILPLLGLVLYLFYGKNKAAFIVFTVINLYIVTAWDIWDYGGRAMVQSYPVLAFPFALLIEKMWTKRWLTILFVLSALTFTYVNLWWTYHAHKGDIQVIGMTKEYYWKVIRTWGGNSEDKKLLDNPHVFEGSPQNTTLLYKNDFSADTSANVIDRNNNARLKLNKELQYSALYHIKKPPTIGKWVRVSADFLCTLKEWDVWKQTQFIVTFMDKDKSVQTNMIRVHRLISNGESKTIYLDAKTPESSWDTLRISFWNADGDKELIVDNLEVITFND